MAATTPITTIQMVIVVSGPSEALTTSLATLRPPPSSSLSVRAMDARLMITRVRMIAIAAPIPRAIAVRARRRESQIVRAMRPSVTSGRIQTRRSNHLTAVCAGPSASDWSRVTWPKSEGSGRPDQLATCCTASVGSVSGSMTGGLNLLDNPPGSLSSTQTSTWLTRGSRLSFTSLPET